jgi:two-component system chemotaxis sensor kinase CheA
MAKDPFRYFRVEARELLDGLTQGILALERGDVSPELLARLLRLAHTLKGAARVVRQAEVAEIAHAIEDVLAPRRDAGGPLPPGEVARLLTLTDDCEARLRPVFAPAKTAGGAEVPPAEPVQAATVRVEAVDVDAILYDLAETDVGLGSLHQEAAGLGQATAVVTRLVDALAVPSGDTTTGDRPLRGPCELRSLAEDVRATLRRHSQSIRAAVDRVRQDLARIRERVGDLRLLPAREMFSPLERAARDAAEALNKRVVFEATGGEHRLDAHALLTIRDALAHVVRNGVAHGIEDGADRERLGKPREGRIRLRVHRRGGRVHFVAEDDGRGIDVGAVRRVVIDRGLAPPAEAETLGMAEATPLLFRGGFSTAPAVSEVMGRGVGLDAVRTAVDGLRGDVELRSEPGRGTAVEITVPISLESFDAMAVAAGGATVLIPFDAVRRTLRLTPADLAHTAAGATVFWEGEAVPFRPLADVLGRPRAPRPSPGEWTAVVVRARGAVAAVGVDRLEGTRTVVVRPPPELCGPLPLVAGVTLDAAGDPLPVLDPTALVDAVRSGAGHPPEPPADPPLPVLIVDDSLTTRMLEQSILETAGYEVDQATSGEEALEMARRNRYAAFVVDVEMPGMNGFELLERFRADPALHAVPAILVTSRASPEDRRRGELAGARAHIAKSEFDEGRLVHTIRELIGEAAQ